jgi:hypothetical protein
MSNDVGSPNGITENYIDIGALQNKGQKDLPSTWVDPEDHFADLLSLRKNADLMRGEVTVAKATEKCMFERVVFRSRLRSLMHPSW